MMGKSVVLTLRIGELERDEIEALIEAKILRTGKRKMSVSEYTREALREKMQRNRIESQADEIISQRDRRILDQIAALMSKMQPAATAAGGNSAGLDTLSMQLIKIEAGQKQLASMFAALLGDDAPPEEPKTTPQRTSTALPGGSALNQITVANRR